MKKLWLSAAILVGLGQMQAFAFDPPRTEVTPLVADDFADLPGKQGMLLLVKYPPGGSDPIHRHNAHVFVYVLEGTVVMQVRGGKEVTLSPGQTFVEGPQDINVVGRNGSMTEPAKFLAFVVKDKDAPPVMSAE